MKYAPGDKVRIRHDLKDIFIQDPKRLYYEIDNYGVKINHGLALNESMIDLCGQIVTITGIFKITFYDNVINYYRINEDEFCWKWIDEMFEDVNPFDFESLI